MYFHTDAISKEIFHSHSQNMYILDSSSNSCHQQFTKRKKRVRLFPHVLSSLSSLLSSSDFPKNCPFSKNPSFRSFSSTFVSFVQKLQQFSIIASPTLAIIRSRHTGSIPIQCSRHANLSVHHLSPKSTKLPMRK
jgi:hypothetical protein